MDDETQRNERITMQLVRTIETPIPYTHIPLEAYWFPINVNQVRDLEEQIFTRLEMLSLSKKAEDAAKVVFQQMMWDWFRKAQDNATTSANGCLAPVVFEEPTTSDHPEPSNRWGWKSEQEYIDANTPTTGSEAEKE